MLKTWAFQMRKGVKTAQHLLQQDCCDETSCSDLSKDLQALQFKCNDVFGEMHHVDKKGNIEGTVCEQLKNKKIQISSRNFGSRNRRSSRSRQGGRKNKRKSRYYSRKIGPKT